MYYFPWRIEGSVGGEGNVVVRGMGPNVPFHLHPHLVQVHLPGLCISTTHSSGNYFPLKFDLVIDLQSVLNLDANFIVDLSLFYYGQYDDRSNNIRFTKNQLLKPACKCTNPSAMSWIVKYLKCFVLFVVISVTSKLHLLSKYKELLIIKKSKRCMFLLNRTQISCTKCTVT